MGGVWPDALSWWLGGVEQVVTEMIEPVVLEDDEKQQTAQRLVDQAGVDLVGPGGLRAGRPGRCEPRVSGGATVEHARRRHDREPKVLARPALTSQIEPSSHNSYHSRKVTLSLLPNSQNG